MIHKLFPLAELEPGNVRPVTIGNIEVVIVRTPDGNVHALRDKCSHLNVRLSRGGTVEEPMIDEGGVLRLGDNCVLRCPWHGFEFDLVSGRCLADPEHHRVRAYAVTVENGTIYVER
jgi:nitrite reductase/ring-hydroxylating ferredoxin subunit